MCHSLKLMYLSIDVQSSVGMTLESVFFIWFLGRPAGRRPLIWGWLVRSDLSLRVPFNAKSRVRRCKLDPPGSMHLGRIVGTLRCCRLDPPGSVRREGAGSTLRRSPRFSHPMLRWTRIGSTELSGPSFAVAFTHCPAAVVES